MPSTSKKQARFMAAVAHSPEFAKKAGVPMSVGKEFNKADHQCTECEAKALASALRKRSH